jgi:hypothetical protein
MMRRAGTPAPADTAWIMRHPRRGRSVGPRATAEGRPYVVAHFETRVGMGDEAAARRGAALHRCNNRVCVEVGDEAAGLKSPPYV